MLLAFVVAACSSEQASPSATVEQPTPTPEPSSAAPEASGSAGATLGAIPSFDLNGDPELAARFPDTLGGQPLQVQSFRGDQFPTDSADPAFQDFLTSIGADLEDVSVAFGGAVIGQEFFSAGAFRVLGASEDDLEREFIAAADESGDMSGLEPATVGGKDILTGADPSGQTEGRVFLYTKDDTLYFLTGSEELAAEVLEALP